MIVLLFMLMVENDIKLDDLNDPCRICNGSGTTELYREDLEEYEDVECVCQKSN